MSFALLPRISLIAALAIALSGCVSNGGPSGPVASESFLAVSPMRWDHRPEAKSWTIEAVEAVAKKDAVLAGRVPKDIKTWCPGYEKASISERRAFWVGLMSAVSKHESTWQPNVTGGGGRYVGLMQISPTTAKGHGCDAKSAKALKDGGDNLSCAVEIFAEKVGADGVVAGNGRAGLGRDWGPFHNAKKRAEMAAWTSKQPYCKI